MKAFTHIKTKQQFIERASKLHNDKYDYSKVEFPKRDLLLTHHGERTRTPPEYYRESKVIIICPAHGEFLQTARKHIEKGKPSGCHRCAIEARTQVLINSRGEASFFGTNTHEVCGDRVVIKTTPSDGIEREILISKEDFEILHYTNWYCTGHQKSRKSRTNYCVGSFSSRLVQEGYGWMGTQAKIHRLIMARVLGRELKRAEHVDHINGNGLDNRRENLRIATNSQNHGNMQKQRGNYWSVYKGVYRDSRRLHLGWYACIGSDHTPTGVKREYLGRYESEVDAAKAYDKRAKELFGEFAYLNFPEETN